jgi:hypothetical protein
MLVQCAGMWQLGIPLQGLRKLVIETWRYVATIISVPGLEKHVNGKLALCGYHAWIQQ